MAAVRYQLDVRDNFSQLSSCLANNDLLSQFVFSEEADGGGGGGGGGEGHHRLVKREEGTARSCSDPLSFASFLAFALAVANLMMGRRRRRRRSPTCLDRDLKEDLIMATSTVITGVVASYDESGGFCRSRTLCDTGARLRQLGRVGRLMAEGSELLDPGISQAIQVAHLVPLHSSSRQKSELWTLVSFPRSYDHKKP